MEKQNEIFFYIKSKLRTETQNLRLKIKIENNVYYRNTKLRTKTPQNKIKQADKCKMHSNALNIFYENSNALKILLGF